MFLNIAHIYFLFKFFFTFYCNQNKFIKTFKLNYRTLQSVLKRSIFLKKNFENAYTPPKPSMNNITRHKLLGFEEPRQQNTKMQMHKFSQVKCTHVLLCKCFMLWLLYFACRFLLLWLLLAYLSPAIASYIVGCAISEM